MTSKISERPSFAKVVAMHPTAKSGISDAPADMQLNESTKNVSVPNNSVTILDEQNDTKASHPPVADKSTDSLNEVMESLQVSTPKEGQVISEPADEMRGYRQPKGDGMFDDDQTHLSNSSTKPTSFDSKSMASVTTFAMDEKESLRPDDSASVQAVEDDDLLDPTSGAQNSRISSDTGACVNRVTGQTSTFQRGPEVLPAGPPPRINEGGLRIREILPEDSTSNNSNEPNLHGFPSEPDEKLLEAMDSPKDRLLLLQLEEKIIAFIKNSSDGSLELPPCNSFGRLLAHKLGDYYHLTHFVDNNVTSVRLHRTPWSRLPTPLTMLQGVNANTPPPTAPAMKIMRRAGHPGEKASISGSTAPSSSVPSKTTSETGADTPGEDERNGGVSSTGATPAKDRATLTREEREAKYQEVRDRIFRDFPESKSSDGPNSGEQSANISRSNSRTGRKKTHRQRTPNDDGFEARSQFNAYYASPHLMSGQVPFNNAMHDSSLTQSQYLTTQQSSGTGVHFPSGNQSTPMHTSPGNSSGMVPYSLAPPNLNQSNWQGGHSPQTAGFSPFHQNTQLSPMISQQSSTRSSPAINTYPISNPPHYSQSTSTYEHPPYPPHFASPSGPRTSSAVHWPAMPANLITANQMHYTHPVGPNQAFVPNTPNHTPHFPGNFARSSFNPQSRSFAPGGSPQTGYVENGTQPPAASRYPNAQFANAPWQNSRDGSNHGLNNSPRSQCSNNKSPIGATPGHHPSYGRQAESHDSIAKWGTPSHLPRKPPPSEVPYNFDVTARASALGSQNHPNQTATHGTPGPLVVSGATAHQNPHSHGSSASS